MRAMLRAAGAACLVLVLYFALFAAAAAAADYGGPDLKAPPPEGPRWHRTGFYLGALAGWDIAQLEANSGPGTGFNFAETSLMGGGFVGAQARLQDFVIGIEADYLLTDVKAAAGDTSVTVTANTQYLASIRGRAGVPIGPALFYITAGPAFTQHKLTVTDPTLNLADKEFLIGVAFGAGVEAEIGKTLFVRLEGLHYIFPDKDVGAGVSLFEAQNQQTTIRLGIGFRLN